MVATRTPRSRGPREAPAGLYWDQAQLASVVLIRAGKEVLTDQTVRSLLVQTKAEDSTAEVTRLRAAIYGPHQPDTLMSPPPFGESRLVYVPTLEQVADALLGDLITYVGTVDPEVSVILRHNGGQRGKRLLNAIKVSPHPTIQCEAAKNAKDKSSLVVTDVRRAGRGIVPEAVGAFVGALDSNLRGLCSAVNWLPVDTQSTIGVDHVRTYYARRIGAIGFAVADAAVAGNTSAAITTLRHAVAIGTDPVAIVAALAMKVRQLARVTTIRGGRVSPAELGMALWQVDRVRHELQSWSDDTLITSILAMARADAEAKEAGRNPVYAVERAVLTICNVRRSDGRRR